MTSPNSVWLKLWYVSCTILGVPWFAFDGVPLGVYAFVYFWTWAGLVLLTYRISWTHRVMGILWAVGLTIAIFYIGAFYHLREFGDPITN